MTEHVAQQSDGLESIARGLTEAQRRALMSATPGKWEEAFQIAFAHGLGAHTNRVAGAIKTSRCFESKMGGAQCLVYRLTPLGLQVRAILERTTP